MKRILMLWILLSWLIFTWCASKAVIQPTQKTTSVVQNTTIQTIPTDTTYTLQDIQSHNTRTNCRTTVNGKVYNITSEFGKHPWWDATLDMLCWIDWTSVFDTQHWISNNALSQLEWMQIWTLKQ